MATEIRNLYVSYARADLARVLEVVDAVRQELTARSLPLELWMDIADLRPGEQWQQTIFKALEASIGLLVFVSQATGKSSWVAREYQLMAALPDRLLIPVILEYPGQAMPLLLETQQSVNLSDHRGKKDIRAAAIQIVDAAEHHMGLSPPKRAQVITTDEVVAAPEPRAGVPREKRGPVMMMTLDELAGSIAERVRAPSETMDDRAAKQSVFVVHGHSVQALAKLEKFLKSVGIEGIVLSRKDESPQSLFQKFMSVATQAKFAIVLFGSDDYGASRRQYELKGVAKLALQFRARQNVVLELGFFYGRLGWEHVFVVYQKPHKKYPNFERPSDLDGVIFDSMSDATWQQKLCVRLSQAGFKLKPQPKEAARTLRRGSKRKSR